MTTLAFLRTTERHAELFEGLVGECTRGIDRRVETRHPSGRGLLQLARASGPAHPMVRDGLNEATGELKSEGSLVIAFTYSTLGPPAEHCRAPSARPEAFWRQLAGVSRQ